MPINISKTLLAFTTIVALTASGSVLAGGTHGNGQADEQGHGHADIVAFGGPGEASEVSRTIEVVMVDNYFEPEKLDLEAGETVRFVVKNQGEFLHEFNIGTADMHVEHQKEMMTMMEHGMLTPTGMNHDMMKMDHSGSGMSGHVHDDPNSILVEPGATQELVWRFAKTDDLEFACNVPGHYDSGMMGEIAFDKINQTASGS